jgi:hypothetical protein
MKKSIFLLALFSVAGITIYFMMKGGGPGGGDPPLPVPPDHPLVRMIDSVEGADWKNNAQYRRVQTEISMFESNGKIDLKQKNLLQTTLDAKYAISLSKKYNAVKTTFSRFPSALYNEMAAFQSKNSDLPTGVKELSAFIQLQNLEGSVNQFINGRYNTTKYNGIRNQINEVAIGSLSNNPLCISMKSNYLQKLLNFQTDVQRVTELIEFTENDSGNFSKYEDLIYLQNEPSVLKYPYYRSWFNNPNNADFLR